MISIKENATVDENRSYPQLVEFKKDNIVVLMASARNGTVIYSGGKNDYPLGYHSTTWALNLSVPYKNNILIKGLND